jgi:serine/threonine-protein kinase
VLGDRYLLGEPIATGGMGTVYRAVDQVLGRPVAVKVLRRELAEDPTFVERFRREARAAAALSHPNVAGVYDYDELGDQAFIVMELVEGETLAARIARAGPLPWPEALAIGEQVARALAAAHARGLVHRDVKPANVLLGGELGGREVVKVTDFGIAQAAQAATLTRTGMILGSANYVAPEQARGGHVGAAADVYALGCVLFEMVTDQTPYTGANAVAIAGQHVSAPVPNPRDRRPGLPGPVAAIVMRAMHKDPERRFPSADAMAAALAGAQDLAERGPGDSTAVLPPVAATPVAGPPWPAVPGALLPAGSGSGRHPPARRPGSRSSAAPARHRYRRQRGGAGTWVRAAVAVAGAALVLLAWVSLRGGREAGTPAGRVGTPARPAAATVRVPDLRRRDAGQAAAALRRLGFEVRASRRKGTVVGMRPRPGSLARRGATVTLVVARARGKGNDQNQNGNEGD